MTEENEGMSAIVCKFRRLVKTHKETRIGQIVLSVDITNNGRQG